MDDDHTDCRARIEALEAQVAGLTLDLDAALTRNRRLTEALEAERESLRLATDHGLRPW